MTFTFFDQNKVTFDRLCEELDGMGEAQREGLSLLSTKDMETFNKMVGAIMKKYKLKSHGFAILQMVRITEEYLAGKK